MWVECVSRYWKLILTNGDELRRRVRGSTGERKSRCSPRICLTPWEMWAENEERPKQIVDSRAGDETGGLDLEKRKESENLKHAYLLCWYLLLWQACLPEGFLGNTCWSWGLQQWDKCGGRLKEEICVIHWRRGQEVGTAGVLLQDWVETRGLNLEEKRGR